MCSEFSTMLIYDETYNMLHISPIVLCLRGSHFFCAKELRSVAGSRSVSVISLRGPRRFPGMRAALLARDLGDFRAAQPARRLHSSITLSLILAGVFLPFDSSELSNHSICPSASCRRFDSRCVAVQSTIRFLRFSTPPK